MTLNYDHENEPENEVKAIPLNLVDKISTLIMPNPQYYAHAV